MDRKFIILAGMPRSGTTWLGKIFDSHPDTVYRHEPDSVHPIQGMPLFPDPASIGQYRRAIGDYVAALPAMSSARVGGTLPIFAKSYYSYSQWLARRAFVLAGKCINGLLRDVPIPETIDRSVTDKLPLIWKSIESMGRLGLLCQSIEHCRCIVILRHPCGCIASTLRGEAQNKFLTSSPAHEDYDLYNLLLKTEPARRYRLTLAALRRMDAVERLAWRWVLYNERAMDDVSGSQSCTYVRYEDVCADPMSQSRALFDFAGLRWTDQTESFVRESTAIERTGYYSVFKNPVKSAHKWKDELCSDERDRVLGVIKATKLGALYT